MSDPIESELTSLIENSPYLSWLGLEIVSIELDKIHVRARWRSDWVANPTIGQTQGGILAALVDFAADFSLFTRVRRPLPTIDLRIDYHRMAKKGSLLAEGSVVKYGSRISVAEARVTTEDGELVASGRGTFLTQDLG